MVAIAPFRALRYNPERIGDLSAVVAPPYDVISPHEQDHLYQASPYNVVRLILGKQRAEDTESDNRYTRAKQTLEAWRAQKILIREPEPAVYLYEHAFRWQGELFRRLGFVALLEFEGSMSQQVFPHEATFGEPKADRARLLEAVGANLSPIFCVAADPHHQIADLLRQLSEGERPVVETRVPVRRPGQPEGDGSHEAIRMWVVTEPALIAQLKREMASVSVLIADGHHRFEVAFSKRQRFGAVMTFFCCMEDPAVQVRPIHRVMRVARDAREAWRSRLAALCTLKPVPTLDHLTQWLATPGEPGGFGYYQDGQFSLATLQQPVVADWLLRPSMPLAQAGLDVTILHEVVIPKLLDPAPRTNHLIRYTPDPSHAIAMADDEEGGCAWLLRGIPLQQVFALASHGLTMPQKSTYFYPKVLSGLWMNPFDA